MFESSNIRELVIHNIHISPSYDMSKFLLTSKSLKKLSIAMNNVQQIDQFIISLSTNKSITWF
jgi:sporulation protein YlmC with PRC-barrel domain